MRQLIDRLMQRLGYVRLQQYGYQLSPQGTIVKVTEVSDDRFAPPPPAIAGMPAPSAVTVSPPMLPARVSAPPPIPSLAVGTEPNPLFDPRSLLEEPAPMEAALEVVAEAPVGGDSDGMTADEAEEWEWRMALARARSNAEQEQAEDAPTNLTVAQDDATHVAAEASTRVAPPNPPLTRSRLKMPLTPRTARVPVSSPSPFGAKRGAITGIQLKSDRSQLPGSRRQQASALASTSTSTSARTSTLSRNALTRSVGKVATPAAPHIRRRPQSRLARGTEGPAATGKSRGSSMQFHLDVGDTTATDITALDRAAQSMRPDEDTCVTLAVSPDQRLGDTTDDHTSVDLVPSPTSRKSSPLPRLTSRLGRLDAN